MNDQDYMAHALALAKRGFHTVRRNPRVGCVIVKNDQIVGEGWHQIAGEAHAEVHALATAGKQAQDAICFVTLEPCAHYGKTPPCVEALIRANIRRVVIATQDPNPAVRGKGIMALRASGIEVEVGLLEQEAQAINAGFFQRMQIQRPYVRVKMTMSLDGKSQWITSEPAQQDVQQWRARSCVILTSSQTVIMDNPQLNVCDVADAQQPLHVVIDTQLHTKPDAKIYKNKKFAVITGEKTTITEEWKGRKEKIISLSLQNDQVDLHAVMHWLGMQEMNEVWVEANAQLAEVFFQSDLVDEWVIYTGPMFLDQAQPLLQLAQLTELSQIMELACVEYKEIGKDLRIIATRKNMIEKIQQ